MNLKRYIIISVLTHLLLFGILVVILPVQEPGLPVFDVDIIAQRDLPDNAEGKTVKPPLQRRKKPVRPLPRPKPPDPNLPPETMFGGDGSSPARDIPSPPRAALGGNEKKQKPSDASQSGDNPLEQDTETPRNPRDFLFDRETIERFARKPAREGKSFSFDAPEFHHRGYMRLLKQRIESIWQYPENMAERGISGDLYISFHIRMDGSLGEVRLVRTSGYRDLDEAAIQALKDSQPFWPLPKDWEQDGLEITGHFIYLLGRTYIL